jgi:SAM-dependent methyltransferase
MTKIIEISDYQNVSMSNDWFELTDLNHFWVQWRFRILQSMLKPLVTQDLKILEIGCGNGLVMHQLEKSMNLIIDGCDLNRYALDNLFDVSGNVFLYDIYDLKLDMLDKYDVIIMLDVIEHIDNDIGFMQTALKYLKKSGYLVVGVPALQSLFSKYDAIVGHKRRYSIRDIDKIFKETNVELIRSQYWGLSLLILIQLRKIYLYFSNNEFVIKKGFKPPGRFSNWILIQVMKFETLIFHKPIIGTSILSIGQKKIK